MVKSSLPAWRWVRSRLIPSYTRCVKDLLHFLDDWFAHWRLTDDLPPGLLADHVRQGRAWLLLDALDEVADPVHRETVRTVIQELAGQVADTRLIVTARVPAYRSAPLTRHFTVVTVRDLDEEQRTSLVYNIYRGLALPDADDRPLYYDESYQDVLVRQISLRGRWLAIATAFLLAAILVTPMMWYIRTHPAAEIRTGQVNEPLTQLLRGNPKPVLENALIVAGMFGFTGEPYWQVNIPDRPVFVEPVTIALFYGGLLLALWHWRQPRYALLLVWLAAGLLPSVVTADPPSFPRAFAALPTAFILPGLAARALWDRWRQIVPAVLALAFALNAGLTYRDYFVEWAVDPNVRYTFQTGITQAARYLDTDTETTPVVMAGLSVHDVDPLTLAVSLSRRDRSAVRWCDTQGALALPGGSGPARLLIPDVVPLDPVLADQLAR